MVCRTTVPPLTAAFAGKEEEGTADGPEVTLGPPLRLVCDPVMDYRFGAITVAKSKMTATTTPTTERRSRTSMRLFGRAGGGTGAGGPGGDSYGLATGSYGSGSGGAPPSGCPHFSQKSESAGKVAPQLLHDLLSGNIITSSAITLRDD
jgi:hypothetical protein